MAEIERRAAERGLQPIRWPDPWPSNTLVAMRAATFAQQAGRAVAFSLAAFRQAFAAGRDLSVTDNVLIAAAACEPAGLPCCCRYAALHPRACLAVAAMRLLPPRACFAVAAKRRLRACPAVAAKRRRRGHGRGRGSQA